MRFLSSIAIAAIVAFPASAVFTTPVRAQNSGTIAPRTNIISVSGRGQTTAPATIGKVQISIESSARTASAAQQEVATRANRVVALLRRRQAQSLTTTGVNLAQTFAYENNQPPRLTGYSATNSLSFKFPSDRVGTLLDEIINAGATRINSVTFIANDRDLDIAKQRALQLAASDARERGEIVLRSLGLTSKGIVGIQVEAAASQPPQTVYNAAELRQSVSADSTPTIGGEQQVEASVTLQMSY
jgi:uncharacterized protein